MIGDKVYLIFTGYHSVAAASDVLSRYNIANRIVRAPVGMKNSCSFAVLIDKSEEEMSRYLLNMEKINVNS